MGIEATCRVVLGDRESVGKAHCGDGEIDFRGDFRFRWKWSELGSVESEGGTLRLSRGLEQVQLHLGDLAEKWEHAIRNPKSRLDKFGLKAGHHYQALGLFDDDFISELQARASEPGDEPLDLVFQRLDAVDDLPKLLFVKTKIAQNGMIWAVWPKGRKEFREDDIRNFALANGLVDVKVASFSTELSALKLVIPVALRSK